MYILKKESNFYGKILTYALTFERSNLSLFQKKSIFKFCKFLNIFTKKNLKKKQKMKQIYRVEREKTEERRKGKKEIINIM